MPFPKGKYKVFTLDLPSDIVKLLKKEAREKRTSVSKVVVEHLKVYIKREKEREKEKK